MRTSLTLLAFAFMSGCASTHSIQPQVTSTATDFSKAETITVKLANFSFTPTQVDLQAGHPYVLMVTNQASGGHDFTAPEFFAASAVAPEDRVKIADGEIELKGGETASVHIVPAAGTYKLVCTHFGHAVLGMTGKIVVH